MQFNWNAVKTKKKHTNLRCFVQQKLISFFANFFDRFTWSNETFQRFQCSWELTKNKMPSCIFVVWKIQLFRSVEPIEINEDKQQLNANRKMWGYVFVIQVANIHRWTINWFAVAMLRADDVSILPAIMHRNCVWMADEIIYKHKRVQCTMVLRRKIPRGVWHTCRAT